jgi:hypothetical protein
MHDLSSQFAMFNTFLIDLYTRIFVDHNFLINPIQPWIAAMVKSKEKWYMTWISLFRPPQRWECKAGHPFEAKQWRHSKSFPERIDRADPSLLNSSYRQVRELASQSLKRAEMISRPSLPSATQLRRRERWSALGSGFCRLASQNPRTALADSDASACTDAVSG